MAARLRSYSYQPSIRWGLTKKQLKEATKPLYGFGGKRIQHVGYISLPVSFDNLQNARTEYVTFDVVDMHYPYNAIFDRGLLNAFKAALHSAYVCLKAYIEQGFALGHRNVSWLQEEEAEGQQDTNTVKNEASTINKPIIEPEYETKRVPLYPRVPDKVVMISQDLSLEEEIELLLFLDKNIDVFVWKTFDLIEVSRSIIEHKLQVNPSTKLRKQKLPKMFDKKVAVAKVEVQRLLDTCFIREIQ
jgi:hypothetical protein